ncbi:MAG TPA: dihydrolipoamide acetyltransferase family protein [Nocardioidaceae bacterium]|nr:dihydrolipoamide acetyltransferase family protein [Nocardioidaceae bacterium]
MSDAQQYNLPDVGEGLTEAEIVTWKVKVGDTVKVNDVIVEIETAKSLVELPSPYAGTIVELMVAEGESVAVGTPIISIAAAGAAPAQPGAAEPAPDGATAAEAKNETLVGYGPRESSGKRRPRKPAAAPASAGGASAQAEVQTAFESAPAAPTAQPEPAPDRVPDTVPEPVTEAAAEAGARPATGSAARVLAKPPVRKLAKDLGVDLAQVTATGEGGVVTRADVESFTSADGEKAPAAPHVDARGGERETRVPVKGVRKMTAQAMVDSAFTAPHVTEWLTIDATRTMELVRRLKTHRDFRDVNVSPLLVVAKAICLATRRTPQINASWDEQRQEIVLKHYVNLGIAAATPRGLVVPNIKDADQLSLRELADALAELVTTARDGTTQPAQMSGGSFTITNVGVFGVDAGTPILNPGESGILCMGAIRQQPWVVDDEIKPRWVTTLALSFDHRIVDGEQGSRFLADVAAIVEEPGTALLH